MELDARMAKQPALHGGARCAERLSSTTWMSRRGRDARFDLAQKGDEVLRSMLGLAPGEHLAGRTLSAANRSRERDARAVMGNHDGAAVGVVEVAWFNDAAAAAIRWTAEVLTAESRTTFAALPERRVAGDLTAVHGSPRDPIWEYVTSPAIAAASLHAFETRICLFGHTHYPMQSAQDDDGMQETVGAPGAALALPGGRLMLNPAALASRGTVIRQCLPARRLRRPDARVPASLVRHCADAGALCSRAGSRPGWRSGSATVGNPTHRTANAAQWRAPSAVLAQVTGAACQPPAIQAGPTSPSAAGRHVPRADRRAGLVVQPAGRHAGGARGRRHRCRDRPRLRGRTGERVAHRSRLSDNRCHLRLSRPTNGRQSGGLAINAASRRQGT